MFQRQPMPRLFGIPYSVIGEMAAGTGVRPVVSTMAVKMNSEGTFGSLTRKPQVLTHSGSYSTPGARHGFGDGRFTRKVVANLGPPNISSPAVMARGLSHGTAIR